VNGSIATSRSNRRPSPVLRRNAPRSNESVRSGICLRLATRYSLGLRACFTSLSAAASAVF